MEWLIVRIVRVFNHHIMWNGFQMKLLSCHDLHFQGVTTLHTFKNNNHVDLVVLLVCLKIPIQKDTSHRRPLLLICLGKVYHFNWIWLTFGSITWGQQHPFPEISMCCWYNCFEYLKLLSFEYQSLQHGTNRQHISRSDDHAATATELAASSILQWFCHHMPISFSDLQKWARKRKIIHCSCTF